MADLEDFEVDQTRRVLSTEAFPLGASKVIPVTLDGFESFSTLSRFRLEIVSKGRALKPGEVLGQSMSVAIRYRDDVRTLNGIISRFEIMRSNYRDLFLHTVDLVPPMWKLSLNRRCRIFSNMAAHEIVSKVLQEGGIQADVKPVGAQREYWVQYNESDFGLVSRLLEEQGLFYKFDLSDDDCKMVVGDGSSDYEQSDDLVMFDRVESWQPQYQIGASSFKHTSWDYQAVNGMDGQAAGQPEAQAPGAPQSAVFEYPGRHETIDEGDRLARVRMGERDAQAVLVAATSDNCLTEVGRRFSVGDRSADMATALPTGDAQSYVVSHVVHSASDFNEMPFDGEEVYSNTFYCLPSDFDFRPPRTTPMPVVRGPQTATVTDGPDDYGRAKVQFHWDDGEVSRWVRVAQVWAFNAMGTQFLPRIGSEVVVDFLEGDPDQPIIIGMVYNGKNAQLYETPAHKTQSGIRGANWGEAGAADKSNELRFEDDAGSEEIYIHAQKDFRRVVVNDDALTVEQGNRTIKIQTGDVSETLDQGDYTTKLTQGDHATTLSLGDHSLKMDAGSSTIEAMESITLKVGDNSITIDQTGVSISGIMISLQGEATIDADAPMVSASADGMLSLDGGVVMINS